MQWLAFPLRLFLVAVASPTNGKGEAYLNQCCIEKCYTVPPLKSIRNDPRKAYAVYNRVDSGRVSGSLFRKIVPALSSEIYIGVWWGGSKKSERRAKEKEKARVRVRMMGGRGGEERKRERESA